MKVLHVVTWLDEANSFGGPVTVASNLASELRRMGEQAELVAAGPSSKSNREVRILRGFRVAPRLGFSGIVSPSLLWWVLRNARRFDAVHVHICRDLVTLPATRIAQLRGVPTILQPHGMIDRSERRIARLLDRMATRRAFALAKGVLALTEKERQELSSTVGIAETSIDLVPNGIEAMEARPARRRPVALFASRLHPRKRPMNFLIAARMVLQQNADQPWEFVVAGADEGEGTAVRQAIESIGDVRVATVGALRRDEVLDRLSDSRILVLPSVEEPFPMIVLEALSVGTPVIVSRSCGLADFVEAHEAGAVVPDDDINALSEQMTRYLADESFATACGAAGRRAVQAELTIASVAGRIREIYER